MSVLDNLNVRILLNKIKKALMLHETTFLSFDEIFELQVKRVEYLQEIGMIDSYVIEHAKRSIDVFVKSPQVVEFIKLNIVVTHSKVSFEDILKEV